MHLFSAMYIGFTLMLLLESSLDRNVIALVLQVLVFILLVIYTIKSLMVNYAENWMKSSLLWRMPHACAVIQDCL